MKEGSKKRKFEDNDDPIQPEKVLNDKKPKTTEKGFISNFVLPIVQGIANVVYYPFFHSSKNNNNNLIKMHDNNLNEKRFNQNDIALESFIKRLENKSNLTALDEILAPRISLEDFTTIIKHCLSLSNKNKKTLLELKPGQSIRIQKGDKISRDIEILKTVKGKYKLILETKHYANNGEKKFDETLGQGTFKKVIRCYRIDSEKGTKPWASAQIKEGDTKRTILGHIYDAKKEARCANELMHPNILCQETGSEYYSRQIKEFRISDLYKKKGKELRIRLYSKCAVGSLSDVINGKIKLEDKDKLKILLQIFSAVAHLNSKKVIHQDLKPDNILIFKDKKGNFLAKVSDFGTAIKEGGLGVKEPLGTFKYSSPEILLHYNTENSDQYEYYFGEKGKYRNQNLSLAHEYLSELEKNKDKINTLVTKKNDSWSLGVIYCQIKYNVYPTRKILNEKKHDVLLHGLLHPCRDKRLDSAQATEILKMVMTPKEKFKNSVKLKHKCKTLCHN